MDNIVIQTGSETRSGTSAGIFFAFLAAVAAIFAAVGMKFSESSGILEGLSYYGRYEGLTGGISNHLAAAVNCSAVCLVEILILYLLSFSPLLFPGAVAVTVIRGFMTGAAYSTVGNTAAAMQLMLYAAITLTVCLISAVLLHLRKGAGGILKRTAAFTAAAGACVIGELVLSYLI